MWADILSIPPPAVNIWTPLSKMFGEIFHLKFHDFFGQLVNMKLQRRQIVVENWKKEGYVSAPLKAAEPP